MPLVRRTPPPSPDVQALLLKHLGAIRADFIRTLMKDNGIAGRSNTKDVMLGLIRSAPRDRELSWETQRSRS